jgi:hypothetical protein
MPKQPARALPIRIKAPGSGTDEFCGTSVSVARKYSTVLVLKKIRVSRELQHQPERVGHWLVEEKAESLGIVVTRDANCNATFDLARLVIGPVRDFPDRKIFKLSTKPFGSLRICNSSWRSWCLDTEML